MKHTIAGVMASVVLASCSFHSVSDDPESPVDVPGAFAGDSDGDLPGEWWRELSDPQLEALVTATLGDNLQLEQAWARLAQAEAIARQAGAGRWPTLDASFGASRSEVRSPFAGVDDAPAGLPETFSIDNYSASLAAGYEVDLFRKIGSRAAAATLDARAARDEVEAIALTLAAQVAETWYELVTQRARRRVLERQLEVSESFLEVTRLRFDTGLGSAIDLLQQEQLVAALRARLPLADATAEVLRNQLAALTGVAPQSLAIGDRDTLPELPPLPGTGVPADLLQRRPDVRAAHRRLVAADHRVAAAVADRLPSIRLSGSYGYQSNSITDLFATPVWNLAANILAPLFDAGRRAAEVDRAEAALRELRYAYGETLLQAMIEVENALVQERRQLEHIALLETQVEISNRTFDEAQIRYREGIGEQGYLQVLTALQTQQQAELQLLAARQQALSYRIQLCRALGGGWTRDLDRRRGE